MATVQVDLSEYDMLREAKNKAEKEVVELKEAIKGLKDKSKVILTTEYIYPNINISKICSDVVNLVKEARDLEVYTDHSIYPVSSSYSIYREVESILSSNIKVKNRPYNPDKTNYSSSQYIGFDDVKSKVEAHYKKDIDRVIADYKESIDEYHKFKDKVEGDVREEYDNTIKRLKKDNKLLVDKYEKIIENKDSEICKLQDQIKELSKSNKEKIAELEATIEEAKAKMREITGVKKGFFSKIFK